MNQRLAGLSSLPVVGFSEKAPPKIRAPNQSFISWKKKLKNWDQEHCLSQSLISMVSKVPRRKGSSRKACACSPLQPQHWIGFHDRRGTGMVQFFDHVFCSFIHSWYLVMILFMNFLFIFYFYLVYRWTIMIAFLIEVLWGKSAFTAIGQSDLSGINAFVLLRVLLYNAKSIHK